MKETAVNNKILAAMLGFIFIGGAAAILGIYSTTKHTERPLGFVVTEDDGDVFVCGAYA